MPSGIVSCYAAVRAVAVTGLLLLAATLVCGCDGNRERPLLWTMINVNSGSSQADAHLLALPDGRRVMIDCGEGLGAEGAVVRFLRQRGVRHLDLVVLTHMHKDHYNALPAVLDSGITVGSVMVSLPGEGVCEQEAPWGCDREDYRKVLAQVRARGIPVVQEGQGEYLKAHFSGDDVELALVCVFDGTRTPVGVVDVNDTSLILMLRHGATRALFAADLNAPLGGYLAAHEPGLAADILKVPHHGAESTAPDVFFDKVGAKAALVPAPQALWLSDRCARVRGYLSSRGVPSYCSGRDGNVTVSMRKQEFTVRVHD